VKEDDNKNELIPQRVTNKLATAIVLPELIPFAYSLHWRAVAENGGIGIRTTLWATEKTRVVVNKTYEEIIKTAAKEAGDYASEAPLLLAPIAAGIGLKKGAIKGLFKGLGKGILKKVPW
jgi:hypothetical protein